MVKKSNPAITYSETKDPSSCDKNEVQSDDNSRCHKNNADSITRLQTNVSDNYSDRTLPAIPQESTTDTDLELYDLVPDRNVKYDDNHQNNARTGREHDQHPSDLIDAQFKPKADLTNEMEMGNFYDYPNVADSDDDKLQPMSQGVPSNPTHHDHHNIASNPDDYPSNHSNHKRTSASTNPFINTDLTSDQSFDAKLSSNQPFDFLGMSNGPPMVEENNYAKASPMQELTHRPQPRNALQLPDNHARSIVDRSGHNRQARNGVDKPLRTGHDPRLLAANHQGREIKQEAPVSNSKMDIKPRSSSLSYEIQTTLLHCPCYFVNLSRTTAAQYCLAGKPSFSGTFLIRQSESSDGFALTFNCNGNIKVRMSSIEIFLQHLSDCYLYIVVSVFIQYTYTVYFFGLPCSPLYCISWCWQDGKSSSLLH